MHQRVRPAKMADSGIFRWKLKIDMIYMIKEEVLKVSRKARLSKVTKNIWKRTK